LDFYVEHVYFCYDFDDTFLIFKSDKYKYLILHNIIMSYKQIERTFDGKAWKSGNALVITIPIATVEKFKIKEGDLLEITIKK